MSDQALNRQTPGDIGQGNAPYENIVVIINPASGQDRPVLSIMNRAFHVAGINWEVRVTKKEGDATRYAHEAAASGVDAVGVYGGDGTVMEVANGMKGSDVPLAIFPGGTANVMSVELGIPNDLTEAMALVCRDISRVRKVDLGKCGDRYFLLRVGIGFEANLVERADREFKDRMGNLAYIFSALQADRREATYRLVLDESDELEIQGISCMIANSGNIGIPGLSLSRTIEVSDGLLDVLVIHHANLPGLVEVAASAVGLGDPLSHYQVKSVRVFAEPSHHVVLDGEPIGETPVHAEVVPDALNVIVPRQSLPGVETRPAEQAKQR